jgi:biopolymer transport protein ExbB
MSQPTLQRLRRGAAAVCCAASLIGTTLPTAALAQPAAATATVSQTDNVPPPPPGDGAPRPPAHAPATKVDNPYGLEALWTQSDFVAKAVLVIMAIMSMGSWYIIVTKVVEQSRMARQSKVTYEKFWKAGTLQQGSAGLEKGSPFRFLADSAIEATGKHEGLLGNIALHDWVSMSIQRATERIQSTLQGGLAFLATVGSTAPFVGLFGTVWGIYHALTAIGIAGQASIDKVAGPVGEALIMTAIGLAVAVPAVLGYNWLVRRNKAVMDNVRAFGSDLHAVLLSQAK